ncbi:transporter [Sphingobium aromaticiconvertens]|uniref:transporter n=1 Tax=Sphingobium aromaticiconvertens TaxID=365341 RepID=UPI00301A266C
MAMCPIMSRLLPGSLLSAGLLLALLPATAWAQGERDLCADRPGLGTPACTMEPGRVVLELGLGDWMRERDGSMQVDTIIAGDALARLGLTEHLEAQIGWTGYGYVRTRDRTTGMVDRTSGMGDVALALRRNLQNPNGSGVSIALMPCATLPVGGHAIGAGDWAAGLLAPVTVELNAGMGLELTPEVDAAVDEDGSGRHLAYGSVAGLTFDLFDSLSSAAEFSAFRDEDPSGHATQMLAGLSLGWQPSDDLQLDIGANLGLNHDSPDTQFYIGVAQRF